ncbi:hypothetical protein BTHE68_63400 (plasmid) [Burkholderia sp. THE68]|nr:hypothetical protein BTHE68_63400 [Burkholderia sp. THE68]
MPRSRRGMTTPTISTQPENKVAVRKRRSLAVLAAFLLSDAVTDVELVSRELSLAPAMLERMRHALDCLQCVGMIFDTETSGQFGCTGDGESTIAARLREHLGEWPDGSLEVLATDFLEPRRDTSRFDGTFVGTESLRGIEG